MAKVIIIILNWNGWKDTIQCLESLMRSSYADYRVVVCDNDSTDDSLKKIKAWASGELIVADYLNDTLRRLLVPPLAKPLAYIEYDRETAESGDHEQTDSFPLVLIQTGSNAGYAGGNNVGIRYALQQNADYIWLLNNDTVITRDTLAELVDFMATDNVMGLAGSVIYLADQPERLQTYGGGRLARLFGTDRFVYTRGPIDYVSGTSLFIRREVVETIGLLDETFFFYWEDTDYSTRAKKKGWKLGTADSAIVYHRFSASVGGQSLKSDLFKVAAMTRYFKKHWRWVWFFPVMINVTGMIVKRFFRCQFTRIFPILKETLASLRRHIAN